ncbi:unnamed protein product [Acanthoscelides obtectus]|uniref:Uncharacterized protein n=1 Tax=Acanthoscelides obtectus TaxID=200917 RepID=A0A9P0P480_ACAOB|nr:unnamed protein product [Acanthoscelides obtectus]CAK1632382.1 hypothetical protein AOBTE_LOCUS7521 [Acanthoscelides obtectus]
MLPAPAHTRHRPVPDLLYQDSSLQFFVRSQQDGEKDGSRNKESESDISSLESTGTDSDAPLSKHPMQVPEPGSSQDQGVQNILQFLGNQASAIKGPEVSTDVAALISEFLLKGIDKESRKTTLESYPCLANCPALQPPMINPEFRSCLSIRTNAVKEDTFLSKLQLQLASGISALAVGFVKQYEKTKSNSTAPLKIIADVFHAISLHRRYSILPFLDGNVRKFSDTCPIDEFLFGKTFPDQWKSASEAQRLGFSIEKKEKALGSASSKPVVYKKLEPKPGPSRVPSSLNSRRQISHEKGGGEVSFSKVIPEAVDKLRDLFAQSLHRD